MTETSTTSAPFSIEETAIVPPPGMKIPTSFSFSRDDAEVTYLLGSGDPPVQQLQALSTSNGATSVRATPPGGGLREENLSPEEELRRQRERSLSVGITRYSRAENSDRILVPIGGDIYVQDTAGAPLRRVVSSAGQPPALTPALSPDGSQVAFVREGEVYVVSADGGAARQVTSGAREAGRQSGVAEYIVQEEFGRAEGFWWSPDGQSIAFTEIDESPVPPYRILHLGQDTTGPEAEEVHRYPFAGAANAAVRLGVVPAAGGAPMWMDIDLGFEVYLPEVFWWRDGTLGAILVNREQTAVYVARFDPATGTRTVLHSETSYYWINLRRDSLAQLAGGGFLWASERSGFRHLYAYSADGQLIRQLTDGEWMVDDIAGVDDERGIVYFTGNREHPTETQLYAVPLAGGEVRRITTAAGTHAVTLDHGFTRFIDVFSALDTPPTVTLRSLEDGRELFALDVPPDPRVAAFHLAPPELVTLTSRDGVTLHGAVYRPPASFGSGPYPTIVHVYGGPGPQMVTNSWGMTSAMLLQYLRVRGFLVFRLDNRGSARRGLVFEGAIRRRMGTVEVEDQVDGVRWLVEQGLADPARVGIFGASYGGYMTLMSLLKAPETFSVGVATAPVTSWDGYDTAYTERYMSTPQANPEGYAQGSVLRYVDRLRGKLLLVHGMIDENVHFRHTARLLNALIAARKDYDTLFLPDERHMVRHLVDRTYLNERTVSYFERNL